MTSYQDNNKIQFGLSIPQGWRAWDLPIDLENNPTKQYQFSRSIAMMVDKLWFDSIYAYDHFIPHHSDDVMKNIFECFTLLTSIAASTRRIKIGQIVLCNSYRHPSMLAKMLSTLDIISNGRLELGIGAGWYDQEYNAYGYNYPSNIIRIKQLDESLIIIRDMWTNTYTNFQGKFFTLRNAICNPKPIQKPYPVIMVGGSGEKYLLKVVAKHADRYNLFFGSPREMKKKISILKDYCKSITRYNQNELRYSVVLPCIIREKEQEAYQILERYKNKDKTVNQYKEYLVNGITIGDPDTILKGLKEYTEIGVTHFIMHFIGIDQNSLRLFNSKIIKKLK